MAKVPLCSALRDTRVAGLPAVVAASSGLVAELLRSSVTLTVHACDPIVSFTEPSSHALSGCPSRRHVAIDSPSLGEVLQ